MPLPAVCFLAGRCFLASRCFPCWQVLPLLAVASRWLSATAPLPVAHHWCPAVASHWAPAGNLLIGAPAGNKPHLAEKSTLVWLAIWRTWAGFANSQHRDAANPTPKNICSHFTLLPPWTAAQTDANLSAHLHRLPTPPTYLRQMRMLPGRGTGVRCWMRLLPAKGADVRWQMMLLVVRGAVPANHRARESLF